jgi:hypothetical protein
MEFIIQICTRFHFFNLHEDLVADPWRKDPIGIPIHKLSLAKLQIFTNASVFVCTQDSKDMRIKHDAVKRVFRVDAQNDIATSKLGIIEFLQQGRIMRTTANEGHIINIDSRTNNKIVCLRFPKLSIFFLGHHLKLCLGL